MRLANVAGLYVVRLRGRLGQELLAFVGIAVGVGLLFAALVANSSLTGSFERLTAGIVGDAQYQLTARGATMSEGLLARAQQLPGVERAAGVLEVRGEIRGPRDDASVLLLGVTPELGQLGGPFSKGFSYGFLADVRAVALPTPLSDSLGLILAQPVPITLGGRDVEARLGAKLQRGDIGGAIDSPVVLAPLRYAQELTDKPAQVSRVFVLAKPGEEEAVGAALKRLAGRVADVRPADFDAALFRRAAQPTSQSTAMFSVLGAVVGFLFAFSAMLLTVPQRRRLIVDLENEGYRPRTIFKVLAFDALVLGVVASAVGIYLGSVLAHELFEETPSFLRYAFAVGEGRVVELRDVAIAGAGGLAASCFAVIAPTIGSVLGWQSTERPTARPRRVHLNWAVLAGFAFLAAGVAIVITAPASTALGIGGLIALTIAMLLLLPAVLNAAVSAVEVATDNIVSVVPFIATFDLRDKTARARSLAVAATGAVAVFGAVALQGAHADLLRGLDRTTADVVSMGDLWALPPGDANLLVTTPFPEPRLEAGEGLDDLRLYRGGFLDVGDRRAAVFGPPPTGKMPLSRTQLLDGELDTTVERLRAGNWVVLSSAIAEDLNVRVGDEVELPTPVPVRLRVAAVSTNLGWPPGVVILNADDYARAWGSSATSAVLATVSPGVSTAEARRGLRAALGETTGLTIVSAAERARQQRDGSRAALSRLSQIATLVLVAAVIAMASAMGGLIWQRRTFLAGVKVEGYSTATMWRALLLEAGILIGVGCILGAAFGLLGQSLLSRALTSVTGFPVVYSMAAVSAIVTCLAVVLAAVAIVGVFGQRAASVAPESGIRA